jgi:hypothetical protein
MKARSAFKWTIRIIAIVVLIGVGAVVCLFIGAFVSLERGERHRRQFQAELDSGRYDFGDQPALFAVAQGIVKNDPDTIRVAAKGVPDLQAPGRDGETLLNFAVRQSWQRPESVDQRARLDLLLDRGADINSTMPKDESEYAGYSLLLYRMRDGLNHSDAYADALHLLERGADPNRVAADGMTLEKMLKDHQSPFRGPLKRPPTDFTALWDWAEKHGIVQ